MSSIHRAVAMVFVFCGVIVAVTSLTTHTAQAEQHTAKEPNLVGVISAANAHDTVYIDGYHRVSDIVINKPLVLIGRQAVIDAEERGGSVLTVRSDSVEIRDITVKNVRVDYTEDNAAIKLDAVRHVVVASCHIDNGFFGIYLSRSRDCTISDNILTSKQRDESSSGNGIHLWTSVNVRITGNHCEGWRDGIYFEFVHQGTVQNNVSTGNVRYGLHFMFSDSCTYSDNAFLRNGAGVAVMFTRWILMERNRFADNWGAASYGLLLKEITDCHVRDCVFEGNSIGIHAEGSMRMLVESTHFRRNGYAFRILGNCTDNTVTRCDFDGNTFDVTTNTSSSLNNFDGNCWTAYKGYDLDKDGYGDVPHMPVRLYAYLVESMPSSILLMHSTFIDVLDIIERLLPTVTPENLVDRKPLMAPYHGGQS